MRTIEQGVEYNPETAKDLRPRRFTFATCGEEFSYELQIPEYILARLDSCIMDGLNDYMNKYATEVVVEAIRGGYLTTESGRAQMRRDVVTHLKNYIWERFSITQEEAGNQVWQTAPTLQKVHDL
jgi:hypothetical protein